MPVLKKIVVKDFRNIELQELEFSSNINCITGGNGEGKTNLLDAIYYLSMTKSAFGRTDKFNFRHGCKDFAINGHYSMTDGLTSRFSIHVEDGGDKKLWRNDKAIKRVSEHIGILPVVMVSPADAALVSESGEERRRFVNSVLSQMDSQHIADIQQYNRLLQQRNRLLKEGNPDTGLLEAFDYRMAGPAATIQEKRKLFAERLLPVVRNFYHQISGSGEDIAIEYKSDMSDDFMDIMARNRSRDIALGYTTSGVQRDDFLFTMNGYPIRRCGSQGQQKSFLVALKFAQYQLMKDNSGIAPTLLLDDLFDKLAPDRIANLLKMVSGNDFGQIFISDADEKRTESLVDSITSERSFFQASSGCFIAHHGKQ